MNIADRLKRPLNSFHFAGGFLKHHRKLADLEGLRLSWYVQWPACVLIACLILIHPIVMMVYLIIRGSTELNLAQRLRFHWARPLTSPLLEGSLYSYMDYFLRYTDGSISFRESKLSWHKQFKSCGLKTPELFLFIDRNTTADEADRIPRRDIVVKRNHSGRGAHVYFYLFDERSSLFNNKYTALDILRIHGVKARAHPEHGFLVTEFVKPSHKLPYHEYSQHIRCLTVRRVAQPKVFWSRLHIQFDRDSRISNLAKGARVYDVTDGLFEGKKIPWYDEAVTQCLALHSQVDVVSVGWDVMLTEQGPCFLEGNIAHGVVCRWEKEFYGVLMDYFRETPFAGVPVSRYPGVRRRDIASPSSAP